MVVAPDGSVSGSVSGYRVSDGDAFAVGLTCGGIIGAR
jgi:xanthine/CO dehydrogenase XdhC/CoxF family maturation factor